MHAWVGRVGLGMILVMGSRGARAQEADSTHRYSIFAGATLAALGGDFGGSLSRYVGLGASRDFGSRSDVFRPRVTVSFDQYQALGVSTPVRVASAVGEAMFLPGELIKGVRPYLFSGVGVFSRLPRSGVVETTGGGSTAFSSGALNYVGWSVGGGVEVGRGFVQYRFMTAMKEGPRYAGFNVGFRL